VPHFGLLCPERALSLIVAGVGYRSKERSDAAAAMGVVS